MPPTTTTSQQALLTGRRLLLTVGCWLLLAAVVGGLTWLGITTLLPPWRSTRTPALIMVAETYALLPLAALVVFGGWCRPRTAIALSYTGPADIVSAIAAWAATLSVWAVIYLTWGAITGQFWHPTLELIRHASDYTRLPKATALDGLLIITRAAAVTGLAEELLFRGLMFGWLRQQLSLTPTLVITSALFMVIHLYPVLAPAVFIYSLVAGWVRERRRSLLPAIALHILTDTTVLAAAAVLVSRHIV